MAVYPEIYTLVRFYRGVDRAAVPDQPSDTRDRYVICLNRGVSRINQSSSAGTHLMRFLVFELLDGPPTKRQNWRVFRYPYIQRDEILQLLETVGVTVIERDYN